MRNLLIAIVIVDAETEVLGQRVANEC